MSLAATAEEGLLVASARFVPLLKDGCDLLAEILSILSQLLQALVDFIVLEKNERKIVSTSIDSIPIIQNAAVVMTATVKDCVAKGGGTQFGMTS